MKPSALLLNHHPYGALHHPPQLRVPVAELDLHLLTHTFGGIDEFDPAVFPQVSVLNVYNDARVLDICRWTIREYQLDRVIAVHEMEMLRAAALRTEFDLPGMRVETAQLFRDKVAMKAAVSEAGAATVPQHAALDRMDDLDLLDWQVGSKVIKDRYGLGASDVHIVHSRAQAREVCDRIDLAGRKYEVEDFVPGPMYHCDSVVRDGVVEFASISEYLSTPVDYLTGGMLGTVLLAEGALRKRIAELNARVLAALGMPDGVSHLEVFHTPEDELVFCEVAARPGGGAIDRVIERAYGIDIFEVAIRLQAGLEVQLPAAAETEPACGFVGFYPVHGSAPELPPTRFAELGIVESARNDTAGDAHGAARHAADFRDVYVVTAPNRDLLLDRIASIGNEYRATP